MIAITDLFKEDPQLPQRYSIKSIPKILPTNNGRIAGATSQFQLKPDQLF